MRISTSANKSLLVSSGLVSSRISVFNAIERVTLDLFRNKSFVAQLYEKDKVIFTCNVDVSEALSELRLRYTNKEEMEVESTIPGSIVNITTQNISQLCINKDEIELANAHDVQMVFVHTSSEENMLHIIGHDGRRLFIYEGENVLLDLTGQRNTEAIDQVYN